MCNLPGKAGTGKAVSEGQDRRTECVSAHLPGADGGAPPETDASADSGVTVNLPDGDVTSDEMVDPRRLRLP